MSEWHEIGTAPRDGTEVILTEGGSVWVGSYNTVEHIRNGEVTYRDKSWSRRGLIFGVAPNPTHWMPIPALP